MPTLTTAADKAYMLDLPKVSFRCVTDDKAFLGPAGVHSEQSRSYGYNDFSDFERPEHYIRYIEPIESELAIQVEYDMDEQDQEWLDAINAERKKDQSGSISYEVFEIIMDKLEKEWFDLIKRIPPPASHLPVEDSKCSICDDGEGENSNAIVFCDGCNLAVHQDCYGVPYIPEGQWLCRKCTVSPENPVSCLFCPNEGGAFKQTSTGHWSHLLCAIWIPELGVGNAIYMEPVEGVEGVPKNRWKLICSLCKERVGACIQCDNRNCFTAFHVTCARQMGLLMNMKSMTTDGVLRAFCEKHLPAGSRDEEAESIPESDYEETVPVQRSHTDDRTSQQPRRRSRGGSHNLLVPVTAKSARAHAKSYRPGPPLVPNMIVKRLLDYVAKVSIRKRQPFIERLCRYWSLKREARRGAPLLKRLHLEPWTASPAARQETEAEKAQKLKFYVRLRNDLEKVRLLAELVRKREKEKLRQAQIIKDVVDSFIFPQYARLRLTLEKISAMDRTELFLHPVNKLEVPDYFDVVKEPRCWLYIDEKLEKNTYRSVAEFKRDVLLVLDNAMLYNAADSLFHKTAARIKKNAQPLLDELDNITASQADSAALVHESFDSPGDLESSLPLLKALATATPDEEGRDFLASIFSFEIEKPRPPTPPPPPPPVPKLKKRQSEADRKQRWAEKEARAKERPIGSARATRATDALVKAFEEEAGVEENTLSTPRGKNNTSADAGSSRRSTRAGPSSNVDSPARRSSGESSSSIDGLKPMSKPQRGVVGLRTLAILTDRERREQERTMELVADQLDAQDEFKRFNVGWVLPEGSKRRRAERPETPVKPVSTNRKRKTESVVVEHPPAVEARGATPPASSPITSLPEPSSDTDSLSPPPPDSANEAPSSAVSSRRNRRGATAKTVQLESSTLAASAASAGESGTADRRRGRKRRIVEVANEEVESLSKRPLTARGIDKATESPLAKSRGVSRSRGKGKMKVMKNEEVDAENEEMTPVTDVGDGTRKEKAEEEEEEEDEEEAEETVETVQQQEMPSSELSDDVVWTDSAKAKNGKTKAKTPAVVEEADIPDDEDPYPAGTLVWAKLQSYPFFPANTINPADQELDIPQAVLALREEANAKERTWLVQFFDKQESFGWIPASKLDLLGVDDNIDQMYLVGKERNRSRGFKTSHIRQACRAAFRRALDQQLDTGDVE